jgi:iron-sulfur cluster insertion protein
MQTESNIPVALEVQTTVENPSAIIFTIRAATRIAQLIEDQGNPGLNLRVYVQGGGCSGFQYGFSFDESINEDDTEVLECGVRLLIDSMSYQYLVGAEVDYVDDLSGMQFVVNNPQATSTCGCGSSFSL